MLVKRGDEQKRLMPIALVPKTRLHRSLVSLEIEFYSAVTDRVISDIVIDL